MFNVTPIGSCRITTPLRHGQSNYGINLNLARCYGYCHSPAEAVQLARFLRNEVDIPHDIWPLVSRSHQFDVITTQQHIASDLYVIELASAKELTINGVSIQLNYLNATYPEFFADAERAQRFWTHAEISDADAMSAFLDQEWSETKIQRAQSTLLGKINLRFVTRDSLARDIRELSRILPDVMFVSHVDARRTDGQKIASRSNFIDLVQAEVSKAGLKFYNPTSLMDEFGQSVAIEDDSSSLAHFTTSFSNAVMDEWMRGFIAPKTDDAVRQNVRDALESQLQPQIAAAFECGRFADARLRLEALSREADGIQPLLEGVKEQQKLAHKSFCQDTAACAERDPNLVEIAKLVNRAGALGLFETALGLATQAPGGLRALPARTLIKVGRQAADTGDIDNAFEFALAAYCQNNDLNRASSMLASLAINEEIDLLSELTPEELTGILLHLPPVQKLQLLKLNGAAPTAAISERSTAEEIAEIANHLLASGDLEGAAGIFAFWRKQQRLDRIRDKALVSILDRWVETAQAHARPFDRIQALSTIIVADPRHPGIRNVMRDARVDLVHRIRAAGKDGDIATLDALAAEVEALPMPLPEFNLWRARLRFAREEFERVIELGQSVTALMPETINVWVLLMRAAVRTQNEAKAGEFAGKVIDLACAKTQKLKAEAEAVLHARAVGA